MSCHTGNRRALGKSHSEVPEVAGEATPRSKSPVLVVAGVMQVSEAGSNHMPDDGVDQGDHRVVEVVGYAQQQYSLL